MAASTPGASPTRPPWGHRNLVGGAFNLGAADAANAVSAFRHRAAGGQLLEVESVGRRRQRQPYKSEIRIDVHGRYHDHDHSERERLVCRAELHGRIDCGDHGLPHQPVRGHRQPRGRPVWLLVRHRLHEDGQSLQLPGNRNVVVLAAALVVVQQAVASARGDRLRRRPDCRPRRRVPVARVSRVRAHAPVKRLRDRRPPCSELALESRHAVVVRGDRCEVRIVHLSLRTTTRTGPVRPTTP